MVNQLSEVVLGKGMGAIRPQDLSSISQLSLICAIFELRSKREQVLFGIDGKQSMTTDLSWLNHIAKLLTGEQHWILRWVMMMFCNLMVQWQLVCLVYKKALADLEQNSASSLRENKIKQKGRVRCSNLNTSGKLFITIKERKGSSGLNWTRARGFVKKINPPRCLTSLSDFLFLLCSLLLS